MNDLVTVVMPSYNSARYISGSIESVINQSYQNWELLIVDGGSRDATTQIINQFSTSDQRIILINSADDCGPAHARARGIKFARGKYIAFLDADDLWLPTKLEKQVNFMEHNNHSFTYTLYSQMSSDGLELSAPLFAQKTYSFPGYLSCRGIGNLTVVVRRDVFTDMILNTFKYRAEDTIWWLLIMKAGTIAHLVPEVLAYYRITPGSLSSQKVKNQSAVWHAYREVFGLSIAICSFYYASYVIDVVLRKLRLTTTSFFHNKY